MRKYAKRPQTTVVSEVEFCAGVTCDLCGDSAPQPEETSVSYGQGAWAKGGYDVDNVAMRYDEGSNYPHSGRSVEREQFDVCPRCWAEKVVPWMLSQGASPAKFWRY